MEAKAALLLGNCLDQLKTLPDNSVDSVCTDPPYGLSFMGKKWDYDVPSIEIWREVLRVLKPGGHVLAFGGTRTYHRLVVNIEDAGFEIRDQIQWIYGSGFPKSHDVSKAIDKAAGVEREVIGLGTKAGNMRGRNLIKGEKKELEQFYQTAPATPDAKQWQGYGTALKPANEPICLARKPLEGTVAQNVLKHGVGGLNIDASRIGSEIRTNSGMSSLGVMHDDAWISKRVQSTVTGRWPANVIFDEDAAAVLDEQSGVSKSVGGSRGAGGQNGKYSAIGAQPDVKPGFGDSGGASRFFKVVEGDKCKNNVDTAETTSSQLNLLVVTVQSLVAILGAREEELLNDTLLPFILEMLIELSKNDAINIETMQTLEQRLKRELKHIVKSNSDLANPAEIQTLIDTITTTLSRLMSDFSVDPVTSRSTSLKSELGEKGFGSRFAYVAKASKRERGAGNVHPTVKPIKLMEYLIKLVTPEGGIVLDPFMGSGTTGVAAVKNKYTFIGCELSEEYHAIAFARVQAAIKADTVEVSEQEELDFEGAV